MNSDRRLALPPLGKAPIVLALLLGGLLPAAVAVVVMLQFRAGTMTPAILLTIQGVMALTVLAILLPIWRREARFDGRRLQVKATWYSREAALSDFALDQARVLDLREHTEFKPGLKVNGYALPGLQTGHFRLRDGRKAFCMLTDASRVLALPHADGRVWLLSLEHPQAVLDILRKAKLAA